MNCRLPVILIDPKDYFHHNICSSRAAVSKQNDRNVNL